VPVPAICAAFVAMSRNFCSFPSLLFPPKKKQKTKPPRRRPTELSCFWHFMCIAFRDQDIQNLCPEMVIYETHLRPCTWLSFGSPFIMWCEAVFPVLSDDSPAVSHCFSWSRLPKVGFQL